MGCVVVLQPDAVFLERNESFPVQVTDTLFERFFAHTEKIGDYFWPASIRDGHKSILLQFLHNFFGKGIDGFVAGFLQTEIQFLIVTYFFDKSVNFLTDFQGLKDFIIVQDALVRAIDHGHITQFSSAGDEQGHFLAFPETGLIFGEDVSFMFMHCRCPFL
jgi:hypothetical protein